jgi:hypothetical protein
MRPGERSGDPFAALARALFARSEELPEYEQGRPPALPELSGSDFPQAAFTAAGDRANRAAKSEIERTAEVPSDTKRRV